MKLLPILFVVFSTNLLTAHLVDEPKKSNPYELLAEHFESLLRNFSIDYDTLNYLSPTEKASAAPFAAKNPLFFCTCPDMPQILRSNGMALMIQKIEENTRNLKEAKAHLISVGADAAVTEFLLVDILLKRNPNLRVSIDLIDPIYPRTKDSASAHIAGLLFKSLLRKYPHRFSGYALKANDFSMIEEELKAQQIILQDSSFYSSPSLGAESTFIMLIGFDLKGFGPESGAQAYFALKNILSLTSIITGTDRPKSDWQFLSILASNGKLR